jgi:uncharacterized membrane protein
MIAAVYFAATVAIPALSYQAIQFRVGEAMTLLPLVFPEATIGLTLGCFLANISSPFGWIDMVFGTFATFVSCVMTAAIGKIFKTERMWLKCLVGSVPPVLVNALMLPLVWLLFGIEQVYWLNVGTMLISQTGAVAILGTILILALKKARLLEKSKLY